MKINNKTTIELEACYNGQEFTTHNCEIGLWWGEDKCERVDLSRMLEEKAGLPRGEYKITIHLEKIS